MPPALSSYRTVIRSYVANSEFGDTRGKLGKNIAAFSDVCPYAERGATEFGRARGVASTGYQRTTGRARNILRDPIEPSRTRGLFQ
jgi:hypothetical protein